MSRLPSDAELRKRMAAHKAKVFGNRLASWRVITRLMNMKDRELYETYRKDVVEEAIRIEIKERLLCSWEGLQA